MSVKSPFLLLFHFFLVYFTMMLLKCILYVNGFCNSDSGERKLYKWHWPEGFYGVRASKHEFTGFL